MNGSVNITDSAFSQIKNIANQDAELAGKALRIFVQGGGCSGMEYGFTFDEDVNEDDFTFEQNGVSVIIDSMSMQYLSSATIDFKDDLTGSRFVIDNPNAQTSCGCGSSFNPY
ncbi:MAG: iron-sulfur cluster insertion protein ErpA [Gammaproteobacteria bacterium]|jgi:iron-sulfur cluster insertion protein|nr:iron-sulfur cluster insertion protein ErpA [Gammaproteobacteria bacterium]